MTSRHLGWLSPERFGRAHVGRLTAPPLDGATLPGHVRLPAPAAVYDQATVGRCVAESLAYGVETLAPRAGYAPERPDRTALYYRCRRAIGSVGEDSGAILADGIEVLRGGWERELREPSPVFDASYTTPAPQRAAGLPRLVSAEPLAHDLASVMWELACGHPVVVGLRVTGQWDALSHGAGDRLGAPEGDVTGGHAVCLVGYQTSPAGTEFRVRNSWGASWGDRGEAWLHASWLSIGSCGELHALRAIRRVEAPRDDRPDLFPPKGSDPETRPDFTPKGDLR